MSASIAALQRLARVRERLRDVAAGAAAQSERAVSNARAEEATAQAAAESLLDRTPLGARSVHVLIQHGEELIAAKQDIAAAARAVAGKQQQARQAAVELGRRERSLRGISRLLKVARVERETRRQKAEQRLADDLASVRRP